MDLKVKLYTSENEDGDVANAVLELLDQVNGQWLLTIYRLRRRRGARITPAYQLKRRFQRHCASAHAASLHAQCLADQFGWSSWPSFFLDKAQRDSYLPVLHPVLPLCEGASISLPDCTLLIRDCPKADECWMELVY